jgi:peroxiredoxin
VELQKVEPELARSGIGVIAISYDAPDALHQFAQAKGITFPLLSDAGSRVITELGLLDRDLTEHHAAFGIQTKDFQMGVAYPAVFVLDADGKVAGKRIGENYRVREGALKLVDEAFDLALAPAGGRRTEATPRVTVTATTDSAAYTRYQETRLHVILDVEEGWHVYGWPVPDGYTPVGVEVGHPPEVVVRPAEYPPAHQFTVEGLEEDFNVYDGRVELIVPFAVNVPPGHGTVALDVRVAYQACSQTECLPPASVELDLQLEEAPPV